MEWTRATSSVFMFASISLDNHSVTFNYECCPVSIMINSGIVAYYYNHVIRISYIYWI